MSLRVWLPLDGDLRNQGLTSLPDTSVNTFTYSNGKIGQCATGRVAWHLGQEILGNTWSVTMWVKPQSLRANNNVLFCKNGTSSTDCHIYFSIISTTQLNLGVNGPSSSIVATGQTFTTGTWYHVAATYDGTTATLYLNGIELKHGTVTTVCPTGRLNMNINGRSTNAANTGTTGTLTGSFNDFRLYDHCLSAAEVHEIAQGLVLHYKLDSIGPSFGNPNLLTDGMTPTAAGNGATGIVRSIENGIQKVVADNPNGNWCTFGNHNTTLALTKGDTFTFSLMIRSPDSNKKPTVYFQSGLGYYSMQGTMSNNWSIIYYTGIWSIDNLSTSLHLGFSSAPGTYYIKYFKLEKGDSVTPWAPKTGEPLSNLNYIEDNSGYNHNGTILGNPIISSDTAKYISSTSFPANADGILSTYPVTLWNNAFTYSFWIKPSGENGGRSVYAASYSGTSCSIEKTARNKLRIYWAGSPDLSTSSLTITDGTWQHIAIVKEENKTTIKCYYNGILKDTFTNTFSDKTFSGSLRIARDTRGDATSYKGMMSDFRIYCTALNADDILQLYHTGAKVDNKQNLHTFELNETNTNLLSGILWSAPFSSHAPRISPFTNYNFNGEPQFTSNNTSAGSDYIEISPTGHTYEYDYTISVNAGNQFYIGFERYDANKTVRSNNACVYTFASKPSSDIVKQHYTGTVNLATDGTNPCKYIALRILNGWSGTTSGITGTATIHSISLRQIGTKQQPKITKTGLCIGEELKEETNTKLHKNGIIETNEIIEL